MNLIGVIENDHHIHDCFFYWYCTLSIKRVLFFRFLLEFYHLCYDFFNFSHFFLFYLSCSQLDAWNIISCSSYFGNCSPCFHMICKILYQPFVCHFLTFLEQKHGHERIESPSFYLSLVIVWGELLVVLSSLYKQA